jgi:replicative DNA helicase
MLTNLPAEKALLGCVLAAHGTLQDAEGLRPEDFSNPGYATVYSAMLWLQKRGEAPEVLGLYDRLKAVGALEVAGGLEGLQALTEGLDVLGTVTTYARRIRDAGHRRSVREAAIQAALMAEDPNVPPEKAALDASALLAKLGAAGDESSRTFSDATMQLLERMHSIREGTYQEYIPTGIRIWDELLVGLKRGILTLLGAYPSVGKGAVAGRILLNLAQSGVKCGLFSLEDPMIWIAKRHIAEASGVPVRRLMQAERLPELRERYVEEAVMAVRDWGDRFLIDDRSSLSSDQIAAKARQWVLRHGVDVVVIDNASEVDVSGDDRHDVRTTHMVHAFRNVAKDLNVAVLLLVHFKKPGNTGKEPRFIRPTSDLWKNSGAFSEAGRAAVALWLEEGNNEEIIGTIQKQTEGEKDIDFAMKFNASAGLVESFGGRKRDGDKGYTENQRGAA